MTAAYISFSTGRSPNAFGMIFVRRRSSRNSRSSKFVVRTTRRCRSGKGRWAMHASKSSLKHCTTAGSSRSYVCTKSSRSTVASAADEQVGDGEFAEVPPGEGFVLLPQPLGHLADRRATQHTGAARVAERCFDVPRAQPAREHLHRQALQLRRAARQAGPHAGDK